MLFSNKKWWYIVICSKGKIKEWDRIDRNIYNVLLYFYMKFKVIYFIEMKSRMVLCRGWRRVERKEGNGEMLINVC